MYYIDQFGQLVYNGPLGFRIVAENDASYLEWLSEGNQPASVPLAQAQATQVSVLSAACQNAIYAGFSSSALGSAYTYPAKDMDQQNLSSSVVASLMPSNAANWTTPFWCADANGNWAFVQHTAAQIQQVGIDGKTAILLNMAKNAQLAAQVMAATTSDAVSAITW